MINLESWLHYKVWGAPPIKKKKAKMRHFRRGPARNPKYRAWIRTLPSCVSGIEGCEAAHTGTDGGMRQKSSDYTCVPLTPAEHAEYHQIGKQAFEAKYSVCFTAEVAKLKRIWFEYSRGIK